MAIRAATAAGGGRRYRILVCDDDRSVVRAYKAAIECGGHYAATAHDGEEALAKILSESLDLVLLDGMMPLLDGFEVLKRVRQHPPTENLFVILLTSKAEDQDSITAYHYGADMYLTKPYAPSDLLNLIARLDDNRP